MMTDILIILCLFLLNGFLAMSEISLVSSRRSTLEFAAKNGSKGARNALKLLSEPQKFLSTIQIGISLVGIIAGAYGAEAFTAYLQPLVEKINVLQPYAEQFSFSLIVVVILYFSLLIGELIPKSLALNNPERIAIAVAGTMRTLSFIAFPLVLFMSWSTKLILKIFRFQEKKKPPLTEEELKFLIDTGSKYGVIEKQESQIMHALLKFTDKKASEIMTKREQVKWLNMMDGKEEWMMQILKSSITKYPVCVGSMDKILGVVSVTEALKYIQDDNAGDIKKYLADPMFFTSETRPFKILEEFRGKKIHMGFVLDEQGKTLGLITLHDLVENLMGDLPEWNDDVP